jgi:hypothetical protein
MAETTTTTLTELVNTEVISRMILEYAHAAVVATPLFKLYDIRNEATKTVAVAQWVADAAADIANETTSLTAETMETTDVTAAAADMGILREVSRNALQDSIVGRQLLDRIVQDAGRLLAIALEDDAVALFGSLATTVGSTGVNLSLANMAEALAAIRSNNIQAPGGAAFVLHTQQAADYQTALLASTSTTVNSFAMMSQGSLNSNYLGQFGGADIYTTSLCDTANAGADRVGACFVRGDDPANAGWECFGLVLKEAPYMDMDKDIAKRTELVAVTARWAPFEQFDLAGVGIVTDA